MTPNETARLAAAIALLRPDWPTPSLQTLLAAYEDRPFRDVAIAATWVATDPNTDTPGRLNMPGPWWHATAHHDPTEHPLAPKISTRPPYLQVHCPDNPANCTRAAGQLCASCRLEIDELARVENEKTDRMSASSGQVRT